MVCNAVGVYLCAQACEVLKTYCSPHSEQLLRAYQQAAAVADRMDAPTDAIRYLEHVLSQLKLQRHEAAVQAVQTATCHVIRLAFRSLSMQHRTIIARVIAQRDRMPDSPELLRYVMTQLFSNPPSVYVNAVLHHVRMQWGWVCAWRGLVVL